MIPKLILLASSVAAVAAGGCTVRHFPRRCGCAADDGNPPFNADSGKIGLFDGTLYRCDDIACYSHDSSSDEWLLLPNLPPGLTLGTSSLETATHYLSTVTTQVSMSSIGCGPAVAAAHAEDLSVSGGPMSEAPTSAPTDSPTSAPTFQPLQDKLDQYCGSGKYARRDLGDYRNQPSNAGQTGMFWRCYSASALDFATTGTENCVDNCGLLTSCTGAVPGLTGSVSHNTRNSEIEQIIATEKDTGACDYPAIISGDVSGTGYGASVVGCEDSTMHFDTPLTPYSRISYSSVHANDDVASNPAGIFHGQGQLDSPQAWSAGTHVYGDTLWMQFDFAGVDTRVVGVTTQARATPYGGQYVTKFSVKYLDSSGSWKWVANEKIFDGVQTNDDTSKVYTIFPEPVTAKAIRIYPFSWNQHPSMRADIMKQQNPGNCNTNAVIDNAAVSSNWANELHGWANPASPTCASKRLAVEIDLGQRRTVNTAKLYMFAGDTRSYCGQRLDLSNDGVNWTTMFDQGETYVSTSGAGNVYSFDKTAARYARFWAGRNEHNTGIHLLDVSLDYK